MKTVKHETNGKFNSLVILRSFFMDLIIDFIFDMPLCEYRQMVYDSVFLFIYLYTKMAIYISTCMN